jgi:segregation and condensation protein B
MTPEQIIEATLFASQTPLTPAELARADESLDVPRVRDALLALRERYDEEERAFQLYQLGDGYQLLTRPEYAPYLERFDSVARPPALSRAALEALAIIAYRQPIGRLEIEEIRGVVSTTVLRTLQDWELIGVVGRGEGLGRPMLYGTTRLFLDHFGFQDLAELPRPQDLPVALRGSEVAVEGEATHASDAESSRQGESDREDPVSPEEDISTTSSSNGRGQSQDGPHGSGNGSRPTPQGSA